MQTQGIPAFVLDTIDRTLSPDPFTQLDCPATTILTGQDNCRRPLDFLELVLNRAGQGEGGRNGDSDAQDD